MNIAPFFVCELALCSQTAGGRLSHILWSMAILLILMAITMLITSTAGRKSKVKSQKSKRIQYRLLGDLSWLVYLRRSVLVI